jgi:Cell division protein CrgA
VPKSKVRKKTDGPSSSARTQALGTGGSTRVVRPSPTWYPIVMAVVLVLGLAYIVVYYLAPDVPVIRDLGAWNFAVGFGVMIAGLMMAVRWR